MSKLKVVLHCQEINKCACFFTLWCELVASLILIGGACGFAQSLDLNIGLYTGIQDFIPWPNPAHEQSETDAKLLYLIGMSFGRFVDNDRTSRLGIRFNTCSAFAKLVEPGKENDPLSDGITYRMSSLLFGYQRKLYVRGRTLIALEFFVGPSFFSSRLESGFDYCDAPFCDLPEVRYSLFPGVFYLISVNRNLAVEFRGNYAILLGGGEDLIPFRNGFLLALGLGLENAKN